jgi:hypothetical protein
MLRTLVLASLLAGSAPSQAPADHRYAAIASDQPPGLQVLDAERRPIRFLPTPGRITSVLDAASRKSFLVAFEEVAELWEVSYDVNAEPVAEGTVHDFRLKEGTFVDGFLHPRSTRLDQPLQDLFFIAQGSLVVGLQRGGGKAIVIQLDVRRPIASLELPDLPQVSASAVCTKDGRRVMLTPDRRQALVRIVDLEQWQVVGSLDAQGGAPRAACTMLNPASGSSRPVF